jgi:hypothetical protein
MNELCRREEVENTHWPLIKSLHLNHIINIESIASSKMRMGEKRQGVGDYKFMNMFYNDFKIILINYKFLIFTMFP